MTSDSTSNDREASVSVSSAQLRSWRGAFPRKIEGFSCSKKKESSDRYLSRAEPNNKQRGRKATTHIGSGNEDRTFLLLLLPCPERAAGSSSPARRGQGRLHRWELRKGRDAAKRKKREKSCERAALKRGSEGEREREREVSFFPSLFFPRFLSQLPPPRRQRSSPPL